MRRQIKQMLGLVGSGRPARGATLLIYHRVGGGSRESWMLPTSAFAAQVERLANAECVLDEALDRLDEGDDHPSFVLTFDDGFRDLYDHAWPMLRDRGLPFTLYLVERVRRRHHVVAGIDGPGHSGGWTHLGAAARDGRLGAVHGGQPHAHPRAGPPSQRERAGPVHGVHRGVRRGYPPALRLHLGTSVAAHGAVAPRFRSAVTGEVGATSREPT